MIILIIMLRKMKVKKHDDYSGDDNADKNDHNPKFSHVHGGQDDGEDDDVVYRE